jgi:phosphoserine phosphatase
VDISVQDVALEARGQYLVVLDVDSTLIQEEVVDLLADLAGVGSQVSEITRAAMNGELDFAQSLMARVTLLAGSPASILDEVREKITLTPGARTLCRTLNRLGYRIVLVSGGFTNVIEPIARDLGVSAFRANTLEIVDGKLTGQLVGPIIDREGKRKALIDFATEFNIPNRRTIAIGDGANDIDMISEAGLGVAFNAKLALRESADTTVNVPYLDSVLYLLGITRDEIVRSDRETV